MEFLRLVEKRARDLRDRALVLPLLKTNAFRKHIPINDHASIIDFGDHRIAFDPEDGIAGLLRNEGGLFRAETMRVFEALSRRGGVFVEAGANIGTQTIYALKFGGFDRAVCFEPHPKNAWLLRMNLDLNRLSDRATVIEAAAGAAAGEASLSISTSSGTHSVAYKAGVRSMAVPVVAVEEELRKIGVSKSDIGLAWVDVEGYEGEVLKGWPSLPGTPLCIEYTAIVQRLPAAVFSGWQQWADVREDAIRWRPISDLNLAEYDSQVDLLFA